MTRDDVYELLTVKEYACMYRLHVQTIYTAIRLNRLPHAVDRIGRSIRIAVPRESIEGQKSA
jgi:hypothetical protein